MVEWNFEVTHLYKSCPSVQVEVDLLYFAKISESLIDLVL